MKVIQMAIINSKSAKLFLKLIHVIKKYWKIESYRKY